MRGHDGRNQGVRAGSREPSPAVSALRASIPDATRCSLGVGCDESGACYADAHGQPEQCGRPRYLLVKRGLYYAPNNCGYTGFKERAGRYPATDACPDSGVTAVHEDDADEISPACFEDLAREYLNDKLTSAKQIQAELLEALEEQVGECFDLTCEMCARHEVIIAKAKGGAK